MNRDTTPALILVAPALLFILGTKIMLIQAFGTVTPYWDQWDAEALLLYKPYLEGTLDLGTMLSSHNEHRILFTRLVALATLEATGGWFPSVQMLVNAVIHVGVLGLLLWALVRPMALAGRVLFLVFAALFLAIPFGLDNTLGGFQSQFYILLGFSTLALILMYRAAAFSTGWFLGIAAALCAYFSMSSGVMTVAAVIALYGLQILVGVRARNVEEIAAIVLKTVLLVILLVSVRSVEGHDPLKAHSIAQFLGAFVEAASWPLPPNIVLMLALNAPVLAVLYLAIRSKLPRDDHAWFVLAMALWLGTQWVIVAYGRAMEPTSSRYLDTFTLTPVLNAAALVYLLQAHLAGRASAARARYSGRAGVVTLAGAAGILAVLICIVSLQSLRQERAAAIKKGREYAAQTVNLRAFLQSGDIAHLQDKPPMTVPYPVPGRLAAIAGDETVRSVLHPALTGQPLRADLFTPHGVSRAIRRLLLAILRAGQLVAGLGLGLAAGLFAAAAFAAVPARPAARQATALGYAPGTRTGEAIDDGTRARATVPG